MDLKKYIADVPDFPIKGILFKDITPLLGDGAAFKFATDEITLFAQKLAADVIVGPEARGFIFGCPVASNLMLPFAPVRKPGKLPRTNIAETYDLEYGKNTLCIHSDAVKKGQKVVIIDDLLATGGTILAACKLIEKLGGIVVGLAFAIELSDLEGREKLKGYNVMSLMKY